MILMLSLSSIVYRVSLFREAPTPTTMHATGRTMSTTPPKSQHLLFTLERFGIALMLDSRSRFTPPYPRLRGTHPNTRETTNQVKVNDYFNVTKVKYIIIIHHICTS